MGYRFTVADVAFLGSAEGVAALAGIDRLALTSASYLADVATARKQAGDKAAMLLETVLLRRKAVSKLDDPADWLFTDEALQQATPSRVAEHRAQRFAGRVVHDVTCSIGTELVHLARTAQVAVGSDLDEVRLAMARHNTGVPVCPGERAEAGHERRRDSGRPRAPGFLRAQEVEACGFRATA